jgi:acyl carrier protein
MKAARTGDYDCLVLLSGGKDSTYMLYQLCGLGVKPLVFTLDNGFISEEAKTNMRLVAQSLGVELVVGETPHMNEIFVDSLKRFANVCNGCFKTVYTLATNLAHEKGIRYIVTGLSRGQFFETRLTEDVFQRRDFDVAKLDALVLEARKAYHRRADAVSCHLEVDVFRDDAVFHHIQFVDFYRYWSVPLAEMHAFLRDHTPWIRPSDTGRSTNCLINEVGIYVHKKQRGFHNYALPYSWDVRLGQKTRAEAMAELDDELDEARVQQIMAQIGYPEPPQPDESGIKRLAAYYVSEKAPTVADLRAHLAKQLPDYMLPTYFIRLDKLPLTSNGKIDRHALPIFSYETIQPAHDFVPPRTETEKALAAIWSELLSVQHVGINDDFFDLGGQSLVAIKAVSRIRDVFEVEVSLRNLFERPTVAGLGEVIDGLSWASTKAPAGSARDREEITL